MAPKSYPHPRFNARAPNAVAPKKAVDIAVELYSQPKLAELLHKLPLHEGVGQLIKTAGGDVSEISAFPERFAKNPELATLVSEFYLRQVLFHPASNDFRILGLNSADDLPKLNTHKRQLLKWLHPDRNQDPSQKHLFQRVLAASTRLKDLDPVSIQSDQQSIQKTAAAHHIGRPGRKKHTAIPVSQNSSTLVKKPIRGPFGLRIPMITLLVIIFICLVAILVRPS